MERVTFLIEQTGDQLACLLNPESLVVRRKAGVRARESASGQLTEAGLTDRPLLFTGGGTTEVELELLFDVALAGSSITTRNVRELTSPLWNLAENREETGYGRPPLIRFIWGKTFNLPGIVVGVAERLERFTGEGIPTRSWMRMRVVRVDEQALDRGRSDSSPSPASLRETAAEASPGEGSMHTVTGGVQEPPLGGEGEEITTASDIMAEAFAGTGAASMLASAQTAISGAIDALSEGGGRLSETEDEDPSAAEQLNAAAETFDQALTAAAEGIKEGNLGAVGAAVEQMFSAAGTATAAAASLVSDAGRAVAAEVDRALDTVGPAAEKLLTAAQTVVQEVVQTSARVIADAVATTDQVIDRVSTTAEHLTSAASEAARQAGSTLQNGLEAVAEVLDRIRMAGELAAVELFPEALQQISQTADRLWSVGADIAAERIGAAIEEMAVRLKNMKAAADAIDSVMEQALSRLLRSMTDTVESALDATRESDDFSRLDSVAAQLRAVARSIRSAEPEAQVDAREQAQEAVQSVAAMLEKVREREETARLDDVSDLLSTIDEAAQALEVAEQEEAADTITAIVRAREAAPVERGVPGAGEAEAKQRIRGYQGERLDQIAFRSYGNPAYWRLLALHNDIDHPLRLPAGLQMNIPPSIRPSGS